VGIVAGADEAVGADLVATDLMHEVVEDGVGGDDDRDARGGLAPARPRVAARKRARVARSGRMVRSAGLETSKAVKGCGGFSIWDCRFAIAERAELGAAVGRGMAPVDGVGEMDWVDGAMAGAAGLDAAGYRIRRPERKGPAWWPALIAAERGGSGVVARVRTGA
jgi:hypothetical protein